MVKTYGNYQTLSHKTPFSHRCITFNSLSGTVSTHTHFFLNYFYKTALFECQIIRRFTNIIYLKSNGL